MRLKDPSQKLSSEGGGASAEILDQVLGTADRKRTRPASSLDVKVSNNGSVIRPPSSKKKKQKQQQQIYDQSSGKTTRARGGGGIPNTKFDFSDLEGMTEEEIMQVLYDDPKLAAAATAAAEKMQKSDKKTKPSKPKAQSGRSNYKRSSARTLSSQPDHLKAMMEEGVPVKQWVVLIVLLTLGLYQLRKAIIGSNKVTKPKRTDRSGSRKSPKKGTKKGKTKSKLKSAPSISDKKMKDESKFTALLESRTEKIPLSTPKKNSKKRKARKQKVAISQTNNEDKKSPEAVTNELPDSISTDGSSSVNDHEAQPRSITVSHENVVVEKNADTENNDVDGEWCTVGAANRNAIKPRSIEKEKQALVVSTKSSLKEAKALGNIAQFQQVTNEQSKIAKGAVNHENDKPENTEKRLQDIKEDSSVNSASAPTKAMTVVTECSSVHSTTASQKPLQETKKDSSNDVSKANLQKGMKTSSNNLAKISQSCLQDTKEDKNDHSAKKNSKGLTNANSKTIPQVQEETSENQADLMSNSVEIKPSDTTDDEAIAKKLQLEEEKLAENESSIPTETEWEEVAVKKKKKGRS